MESVVVVVDDLNFFLSLYSSVLYNCQTAFEQGRFAPHPPTYPQHPSQDFCVRYLSYRQLRLEFFFSPLTMLHICMHACICTASHGFLVLPCQKLPYIPEIKIVRKVKRYPTYLYRWKAFNWLPEGSKKGRGIQPPSHYGMILHIQ